MGGLIGLICNLMALQNALKKHSADRGTLQTEKTHKRCQYIKYELQTTKSFSIMQAWEGGKTL